MDLSIASKMASDLGTVAAREVGMMDRVNANHLFYGLIDLALERLTPADGIVREPILQLKSYLEGEGIDLVATSARLKTSLGVEDADPRQSVLDKATLVAGVLDEEEVQPHVIASVILDDPSPTIRQSIIKIGSSHRSAGSDDAAGQTAGAPATATVVSVAGAGTGANATLVGGAADKDSIPPSDPPAQPDPASVHDPEPKPDSAPAPVDEPSHGPVRKAPGEAPVTPMSDEDKMLVDLMAGQQPRPGGGKPSGNMPSWLRTGEHIIIEIQQPAPVVEKAASPAKREGAGSRIIKTILYLVFAVAAPYLLLMALDMTAGLEAAVEGVMPGDWTLVIVVLVWAALILNTLAVAIKNASPPGKAFVQFLIGMGFIWAASEAAIVHIPYEPVPVWLRIVVAVAYLVVIALSNVRIRLASVRSGNTYSTRAGFLKLKGTLQGMFFSYTVRSFIVPVIALCIAGLVAPEPPFWLQVVFALYAFGWLFSIVDMGLQCNVMRVQESPKRTRGKLKFAKFILFEIRILALPLLGVFMMTVFNWWQMPVWLIVGCVIYGLIWLFLTYGALKADPDNL